MPFRIAPTAREWVNEYGRYSSLASSEALPRGGGVDRHDLLGGKSFEIIRTACLWSGAGERVPSERLRANDRADHAAIDIDVAMREPRGDVICGRVDAGMNAEREGVAVSRKLLEQGVERIGAPTHDVKDWPEHLLPQVSRAVERDDRRRHISSSDRQRLESIPTEAHAAFLLLTGDPAVELFLRLGIDHRPDMGRRLARIAERELARGASDHLEDGLRDVLLQAQQAQRRAALAGRAERRGDHIVGDL